MFINCLLAKDVLAADNSRRKNRVPERVNPALAHGGRMDNSSRNDNHTGQPVAHIVGGFIALLLVISGVTVLLTQL